MSSKRGLTSTHDWPDLHSSSCPHSAVRVYALASIAVSVPARGLDEPVRRGEGWVNGRRVGERQAGDPRPQASPSFGISMPTVDLRLTRAYRLRSRMNTKPTLQAAGTAEVDRLRFARLYLAAGRAPALPPAAAIRRRAGIV